jgi:hypothetical protein
VFQARVGTPLDSSIGIISETGAKVVWGIPTRPPGCDPELSSCTCLGVTISLPPGSPADPDAKVTVKGSELIAGTCALRLSARLEGDPRASCERPYTIAVASSGEPPIHITPPGSLEFGKPPNHRKAITVTNTSNASAVGPVEFTVECTVRPCHFTAPDSIPTLVPGASHPTEVAFLSAEAPLWMTDYPATLVVTVQNPSYRFEIALTGNKGEPRIIRLPNKLELTPSESKKEVFLLNGEGERVTNIGLSMPNCAPPCPFKVTPSTLDLEPAGEDGHYESVRVELVGIACPGTADLAVTVPGLALPVATVSLKGVSKGARRCSEDAKSVLECGTDQWQSTDCLSSDYCLAGECICRDTEGWHCWGQDYRFRCSNGVRELKACGLSEVCDDGRCRVEQGSCESQGGLYVRLVGVALAGCAVMMGSATLSADTVGVRHNDSLRFSFISATKRQKLSRYD